MSLTRLSSSSVVKPAFEFIAGQRLAQQRLSILRSNRPIACKSTDFVNANFLDKIIIIICYCNSVNMNIAYPVNAQVASISFGNYTTEEIRQLSVKEIIEPALFDATGSPVPSGPHDPALGPLTKNDQ